MFLIIGSVQVLICFILSGGILLNENCVLEKGNNCSVSFNYWLKRYYSKKSLITDTCNMQTSTVTTKYREEKDSKYLKSVRYYEQVISRSQHSLKTAKAKLASVKVMTYNVLSQTILENHMYLYRKCSPVTLKWQYRHPRLLGEIVDHNPDIVCLQEVEEDHLHYFNKLEDLGYVGVYKKKTGDKIDGCSIFFRANMFSLVSTSGVEYFKDGVKELNRDNIGLILKLYWWAGSRNITIANTHLLYNPRRTDVRLAQISVLLNELNAVTDFGSNRDLVFLTGDLNSEPSSSVIELLTEGQLDTSNIYHPPNPELLTCHNFNFTSVYNNSVGGDTEASTFQDRWVTADYIFYSGNDKDLCMSSKLRLPTSQEARKLIRRLPNYASPSDHLPLVATFLLAID